VLWDPRTRSQEDLQRVGLFVVTLPSIQVQCHGAACPYVRDGSGRPKFLEGLTVMERHRINDLGVLVFYFHPACYALKKAVEGVDEQDKIEDWDMLSAEHQTFVWGLIEGSRERAEEVRIKRDEEDAAFAAAEAAAAPAGKKKVAKKRGAAAAVDDGDDDDGEDEEDNGDKGGGMSEDEGVSAAAASASSSSGKSSKKGGGGGQGSRGGGGRGSRGGGGGGGRGGGGRGGRPFYNPFVLDDEEEDGSHMELGAGAGGPPATTAKKGGKKGGE
jgi:hypothetical protein